MTFFVKVSEPEENVNMQLSSAKVWCFLGLATAATLASAHHGWSWYGNEEFTLTGIVVEKAFGDPHDRMTVQADGQEWNLLSSPPGRFQ